MRHNGNFSFRRSVLSFCVPQCSQLVIQGDHSNRNARWSFNWPFRIVIQITITKKCAQVSFVVQRLCYPLFSISTHINAHELITNYITKRPFNNQKEIRRVVEWKAVPFLYWISFSFLCTSSVVTCYSFFSPTQTHCNPFFIMTRLGRHY